MSDEVTVVDNRERNRFEARLEGKLAGVLTYSIENGVSTMPHTVVEPEFGGRGVGGKLAKAALDDARERGLKVDPQCPFIAGYIERNPEYADLVAPESA